MALETLDGVNEIDGFKVIQLHGADEKDPKKAKFSRDGKDAEVLPWKQFDEVRKEYPISRTREENMISFRIQDGPVKENGVNGCQVDTLVMTAKMILEGLNKQFPCEENEYAINGLDNCLTWLLTRKNNRMQRGVEGENKE